MNIIEIRNLSKSLQGYQIIKKIDLDIKKGEIITLVGPSGSGKSTLLRCLNRLIEPDTGTISYDSKDYSSIPITNLRKTMVMVPQESVMFPGTIHDNISFGIKIHDMNEDGIVQQSIRDAGLSESFLSKNADKISGGEKKRVALARALALQPEVLLLDEPTSGVDPKNIETVEQNIINFTKHRHLTVVWVTHDVQQAKRVSNRIANLKDGRITTVQDVKDFKWEVAY